MYDQVRNTRLREKVSCFSTACIFLWHGLESKRLVVFYISGVNQICLSLKNHTVKIKKSTFSVLQWFFFNNSLPFCSVTYFLLLFRMLF